MITKRQLLELIQARLNGGETPRDRRRVFPIAEISRIVNFGLSDCVTKGGRGSDATVSELQLEYDFTPTSDSVGWYVTVTPKPISGGISIYSVEDDEKTYTCCDKSMYRSIDAMGQDTSSLAVYSVGKIRFNEKPKGNVTVSLIPNVYEMQDDDIIIYAADSEGGAMAFFNMCLQVISGEMPIDEKNNNNAQQ